MKKIALFMFLIFFGIKGFSQNISYQQSWKPYSMGIDMSYNTSNAISTNFTLGVDSINSFSIGYSYQFNGQVGKEETEQLDNYGRTIIGTGIYYQSFDIGYQRSLSDLYRLYPNIVFTYCPISLGVELSIGNNIHYTNYEDGRFNGGGYHMHDNSESLFGVGIKASYKISDVCNFILSYNTIKKVGVGLQLIIKE